MSELKSDIINQAYEELRISGITVDPSSSDNELALARLEQMMNEYFKRNICIGYNFEEEPDVNSTSGIPYEYRYSISCCLARRLLSAFGKGKEPDPILLQNAGAQLSFLHSSTAVVNQINYPNRQSIGSGNRRWRTPRRFYQNQDEVPNSCSTYKMDVGDTQDFVESFQAYLIDTEVISSYTITSDTGLTIDSDSNTDTEVSYRITANGDADGFLQVKIIMTTDDSRIETRLIDFEITTLRDVP